MVDPINITNFNRSTAELEELLLFCVAVAGKTASITATNLERFLSPRTQFGYDCTPFEYIRSLAPNGSTTLLENEIKIRVSSAKLGKWNVLSKSYAALATSGIDLRTCTVKDLEKFIGIGPKTSRFFILHSRPNQRIACIDTHIRHWLRGLGHTSKKYEDLEKIFIAEADRRGRDLAELDLSIWRQFARKTGQTKDVRMEQNASGGQSKLASADGR
jgi:hypothetical protein